jgi:hypothetical protein
MSPAARLSRLDQLPPCLLPILYFALAHLFLIAAFTAVALDPRSAAGFFYQPRTIGIVHLITIGWISASILGALYVIGPMAMRMPMPARSLDYVAFAVYAIGGLGMTGHFFIAEYRGVVWSGGMVLAGILHVAVRALAAARRAPIQGAVKLHITLAFLNITGAGLFGLLLALHKTRPFLPGEPLLNVFAHVHLAALGWAAMMIVGAGYRLMPMVLPSSMPAGRALYWSAILLESGVVGLFVGFLAGGRLLAPSALVTIAGLTAFLRQVRWMLGNRRRPPTWLVLPDYGVRHVLLSMLYAALAAAVGVVLSVAPRSESTLRAAAAYGVFGIVGFLAQMVLGMQARILPMFVAYHANLNAACDARPTTPSEMGSRTLPGAIFYLWFAGVPLLAAGMFLGSAAAVAAAGWMLLAASTVGAVNAAGVLRHAFRIGAGVRKGPRLQPFRKMP